MAKIQQLKYVGFKALPITFKMPWLSEPVTVQEDRLCVCAESDAKQLMEVNPLMFEDLGEVKEVVKKQETKKSAQKAKKE